MKKILICILIIFIISCGSKNNKIDPYKDIIVNIGSDPNTMDPTLNSIGAVTTYILHNFEGLTKIDINNSNNYTLHLESERKVAYLGDCSNIETRMLFLVGILEKEKDHAGEIFINMNLNTDNAYFRESV